MGILSALGLGKSDDGGAQQSIKEGIQEWRRVAIPTPEEVAYEIERYRLDEGLENPRELFTQDLALGPTKLADISPDQRLVDKQYESLNQLGEVAREGYTTQEKADLARLVGEQKATEKGQRDAIIQAFQERGVGGGGNELAAQLMAQQGAANTAAQRGMDIDAMAKQRALEAMGLQANLAGSIRGQEYGEKSEAAKAADAIAQFNAQQEAGTRSANVAQAMDAAKARQQVSMAQADQATAQRAQTPENLKWINQQEMNKAAGISGQYNTLAAQQQAAADAQNSALKNTLSTAAAVVGSIYGGPAGGAAAKGAADAALACGGRVHKKMAEGGPMKDDGYYIVGDGTEMKGGRGPELFVGDEGEARMVGLSGPEEFRPTEDGRVFSNDDTNAILEALTGIKTKQRGTISDRIAALESKVG